MGAIGGWTDRSGSVHPLSSERAVVRLSSYDFCSYQSSLLPASPKSASKLKNEYFRVVDNPEVNDKNGYLVAPTPAGGRPLTISRYLGGGPEPTSTDDLFFIEV